MKIITHLTAGDKFPPQEPELIVIHAMGEFILDQHAVSYLANAVPNPLSAHALIAPDGTNYRCREDTEVAYHAAGHNINSLGLEFLVPGVHNYGTFLQAIKKPYLDSKQYDAGVIQVREWLELWPIKKVVRHSDLSPERKVDPGTGFPWAMFIKDIGL